MRRSRPTPSVTGERTASCRNRAASAYTHRMLRQSDLRRLGLALWVGVVGFEVTGCASTGDKLRTRFARERGCPESQVLVSPRGGVVYAAEGCGQATEYVCGTFVSSSMDKSAGSCDERNLPRQVRASDALPPPPRANDPEAPPGSTH